MMWERERRVCEERLAKEKEKVDELRKELDAYAVKMIDAKARLRETGDQCAEKEKIISSLKRDIEVQDEVLIDKEYMNPITWIDWNMLLRVSGMCLFSYRSPLKSSFPLSSFSYE